ncbi:hypothetical protein BO83DRAFT_374066 [Aspergillus eucalypticola CBS 122712]|uniref:Uncharacterized protein n=1 Tax=Aspergillus eucalypticola (strain CBS 122712 / IBT 29274) TaxID=1448314 RepID=A0A317WFQ5_ASPEC|nr:uncharacterized protein BO83DRAFT_374066 [Aspergillus eucalypticola CBS 122712]PWY85316.1 hypothetical protein BO83DRAFT_374066 [Aspergillus eucalypticola CBS 122712]
MIMYMEHSRGLIVPIISQLLSEAKYLLAFVIYTQPSHYLLTQLYPNYLCPLLSYLL